MLYFVVVLVVVLVRGVVKYLLDAEERHAVDVAAAKHGLRELRGAAVEHAHVRRRKRPVPENSNAARNASSGAAAKAQEPRP